MDKKEKCRYISRIEFRKLISIERKIAKKYDFSIKISYYPFTWSKVKESRTFSNTKGEFYSEDKIIKLSVRGRPGRGSVLAVLYHEMRHLEHYILGLYKDYYYYSSSVTSWLFKLKDPQMPEGFKIPCLRTGFLAEKDCDRYSREKLKSLNINHVIKPYQWRSTLSFEVVMEMYTILRDKERELKKAKPERAEQLQIQIERIRNAFKEAKIKLKEK